ncbi:MAG TPA: chemotaxis protein CheB [Ktedonobacteraceae bacterium]|nr:chemotaxis protein CheB [Ktedonobacteraceae bacterium]
MRGQNNSRDWTERLERHTQLTHHTEQTFPIVGIGASAGGLEAFTHLFERLPATTGMAYVLVQHLDPTHKSLLTDLLMRTTPMDVCEAREGMEVCANHVYIIAPNTDLTLSHHRLHVVPQTTTAGQHLSIDTFLVSLAENAEHPAIGVLLSGTGSDGTRGLQAIKERGGITLAQSGASAKFAAMPQSAIDAGCVDFIGEPAAIAQALTRISRHPSVSRAHVADTQERWETDAEEERSFWQILRLLSLRTAVDFTLYKPTTLKRRVQRRMVLSQITRSADYLAYLSEHPAEVAALSQDFLIGVTAFFRHPEASQALTHEIFPRLLATHAPRDPLRFWVPGCSTGEEVYSLAICLQEFLTERDLATPFHIFGTDVSAAAIEHARKGIYAPGRLCGISEQRLSRFFGSVQGNARISVSIRERCVFAQHNLLKDPPFSHLDVLICQNVLIYLLPVAQKKSLQRFHYALSSHGFLLLGPSETIGTATDLFTRTGPHLYLKKAGSGRSWFALDMGASADRHPGDSSSEGNDMSMQENNRAEGSQKEMDRLLLARYAPASVVIDAEMEILQFRGETSPYLQPAAGKASFNLFKMVRADLGLALRTAISQARKSGQPAKQGGIQMKDQSVLREVQVEVIPLQAAGALVILFEEMPGAEEMPTQAVTPPSQHAASSARDRRMEYLENEVTTTREAMQRVIEEMEATNEELQSANEEILSSNEELRSLNEELETSKEEIQASNEALLVANQELTQRNAELQAARAYAEDIVETIREPLLVLDADLRVQRANPAFYQFFQIEPAETEQRLLFDLENRQWDIPALRTLLEELLPTNHSFTDYVMEHPFARIGWKSLLLNAHRIDHAPLILLAMEDSTARTQADQEKQNLLELRKEFMATASHELKTPVSSVKGFTQLLRRRFTKAGDEQAASMLAKMEAQLTKLTTLINDLLDVTKLEAGQLHWENKPFDLGALVADTVQEMAHTTEQHQIRIEGAIDAQVCGDPERIGQVLTNLLSNAIKYSPQAEEVLVSLAADADAATVGVQDFGIGIAASKQQHLFERFFRVNDLSHARFPGLGLGLYICAEIVKRHGGRMWVESREGVGSTFFFTVPFSLQGEVSTIREEGEEQYA